MASPLNPELGQACADLDESHRQYDALFNPGETDEVEPMVGVLDAASDALRAEILSRFEGVAMKWATGAAIRHCTEAVIMARISHTEEAVAGIFETFARQLRPSTNQEGIN